MCPDIILFPNARSSCFALFTLFPACPLSPHQLTFVPADLNFASLPNTENIQNFFDSWKPDCFLQIHSLIPFLLYLRLYHYYFYILNYTSSQGWLIVSLITQTSLFLGPIQNRYLSELKQFICPLILIILHDSPAFFKTLFHAIFFISIQNLLSITYAEDIWEDQLRCIYLATCFSFSLYTNASGPALIWGDRFY